MINHLHINKPHTFILQINQEYALILTKNKASNTHTTTNSSSVVKMLSLTNKSLGAHIGVAKLQVIEVHRLLKKQRPGMPSAPVELQELGTRDLEDAYAINGRRDVRVPALWFHRILGSGFALIDKGRPRDSEVPDVAPNGAEALGDARVVSDRREP